MLTREPLARIGGRKFALSLVGILCVTWLAMEGKDAGAYGAIALIVGGFVGGNSYVSGKAMGGTGG